MKHSMFCFFSFPKNIIRCEKCKNQDSLDRLVIAARMYASKIYDIASTIINHSI